MRGRKRQIDRYGRGRRRQWRLGVSWWIVGAVGALLIVVVLVVVGNLGRGQDGGSGTPSHPAQVGPVEAAATRIDLGRVPLDRWVSPTFRLNNVSQEPVAITIPKEGVETLEGC